ncbi:glutathione S-transferase family protein [Paracoccus sp. 1_MG-2023]|uniref:glutathione S-transferase family protein n=1 Tax=unclassified Paracoccus (in: a-proteobacteria) TaxID=2688777 RepID=UPI001C08D01D|nr:MULTISPECIES: glutathione S-transferase family protein [unclassified Paracoccus (in: a-proteobacteria)]MBU2957654.1 glutathione S-transferase family protein [Paracoccus sp. C2R09]MDO6667498.1 glutathione S-transferase family protein [Paracoccus sp. 1_MG-2023]
MKLYHYPGSCSTGIHVLMAEIGADFETEVVSLKDGAQKQAAFQAVSTKGKVPTLMRDDGTVLTEFQTIAFWLGRAFPEAGLLPDDVERQARILEALDYMVGTVHMRGYTFLLATGKFVSDPEAQAELKAHGAEVVRDGLNRLDAMLGDQDYLFGDFSIADGALFYICRFAARVPIDLPPRLQAFLERMQQRPAVQRALQAEA